MGDLRRVAWPRRLCCALIAALCTASMLVHVAAAEEQQQRRPISARTIEGIRTRTNANTIAIISGNLNATYISIAYDLSAVLDDGDELRILPVIGKGGGQNIKDVRFLKGI